VFTEQEEAATVAVPTRKCFRNKWLVFSDRYLVILATAFGAGYLIVRPLYKIVNPSIDFQPRVSFMLLVETLSSIS